METYPHTQYTETPRQRVQRALAHRAPLRVPFAWNFGPTPEMTEELVTYLAAQGVDWYALKDAVDDIRLVSPTYTGPGLPPRTDIWGIVRQSQSYGDGSYNEIAHYPLAGVQEPAALESYPWPDPEAYDFAHFREQVLSHESQRPRARKLAIDTCGNPFEIYCWMTGLEEALINVALNPELVHAALEKITGFFAAKMTRALEQAGDLMDLLYFADDLGGQQNLLIAPRTYRQVLKPYHARLFRLGKRLAPRASVMFHTDGAVFKILRELIDAGVEVLEAVQVDAAGMEPERLKKHYGTSLTFHGGISVQSLLPDSDTAAVAAECRHLVEVFGENGGYIAAPTHAIQVGTPPENVLAMLQTVLGDEEYQAALAVSRK